MVSIIIINYNTFELTCNCIRSVYKNTTGIEFEVILVDNGSTDCDAELFTKEFPELILVKSSKNLGFAKGNNLGIDNARGDLILLLNSDTLLVENSILQCAEKLASLPDNFAALSCKLCSPDGSIQQQCSRFPSIFNEFIELTRIHKLLTSRKRAKLLLGSYFDHQSDYCPDWLWGTFFMFKKASLLEIPERKLNDDYFMYCEDMRWCYDFGVAQKQIYYFAENHITHLLGGSSSSNGPKAKQIVENEMDFTKRSRGVAYMFIFGITKSVNLLLSSGSSGRNNIISWTYARTAFKFLFKE